MATITAQQDSLFEGATGETVIVDITSVTNGNESGAQKQVTITITDDDTPTNTPTNNVVELTATAGGPTLTPTDTPTLTSSPTETPTPNVVELTATAGGPTLTPTKTSTLTPSPTETPTPNVVELTATAGGPTLTPTKTANPTVTSSATLSPSVPQLPKVTRTPTITSLKCDFVTLTVNYPMGRPGSFFTFSLQATCPFYPYDIVISRVSPPMALTVCDLCTGQGFVKFLFDTTQASPGTYKVLVRKRDGRDSILTVEFFSTLETVITLDNEAPLRPREAANILEGNEFTLPIIKQVYLLLTVR